MTREQDTVEDLQHRVKTILQRRIDRHREVHEEGTESPPEVEILRYIKYLEARARDVVDRIDSTVGYEGEDKHAQELETALRDIRKLVT